MTCVLGCALHFSAPYTGQAQPIDVTEGPTLQELEVTARAKINRRRGFKWTSRVPMKRASKEALAKRLKAILHIYYSPKKLRGEMLLMKALGFIPRDLDYQSTLIEVMSQGAAGFYDHRDKILRIADWLPLDQHPTILQHELFHGAQDHRWDVGALLDMNRFTHDQLVAHQMLIEGDAVVMMLWDAEGDISLRSDRVLFWAEQLKRSFSQRSVSPHPSTQGLSNLYALLAAPYVEGLKFVSSMRRAGHSWSDFDRVYANPPQSTEQALHPQKYRKFEPPKTLKFSIEEEISSEELWASTLGELYWRALLRAHLPLDEADEAAAGWGGDWIVVHDSILCSLSEWDSELDASDFQRGVSRWLKEWRPLSSSSKPNTPRSMSDYRLERRGARVTFCLTLKGELNLKPTLETIWRVAPTLE